MKLTIARKFGLAVIIMTGLVTAYSLYTNVCMWSLRKSVYDITNKSVPLVIATVEMDLYKTAGRAELKNYLMENDPDKLPAIERKVHTLISEHDRSEIEIGKILDSLCHGHGDEGGEMRKIWDEGMATIMPEFDQKMAETIDAHKHYLKSQMVRAAKVEEHEEYGIKLFKLLIDMHNLNQHDKVVMSAVMELKAVHLDMMNADEKYMTKGGMVTRKERLGFKKEFAEHSEVFGKWLKTLQAAVASAENQALMSKISHTYKEFVSSALEQEQLFDLYEKELAAHAKRLDNLADIDELGHLDSKMAQKLVRLAKEHLRDVESGTKRLVKLTSVIFVIISVIVIFGCWVAAKIISRKIVKPILILSDAAGIIAKGDLAKQVEVFGNDEIGQLCSAFNKMTENLRITTTSIDNLNAANQQLQASQQQLRATNQQLQSEITERKKAENALEALNEDLETTVMELSRSNRELQDFAHAIAHDLKTPLRSIGTLSHWLSSDYADKFDQEGIEHIKLLTVRAERISELIDSILKYSEVGRTRQKMEKVDLNILLTEIISAIDSPENIEITVESKLPTIICEKVRIIQLFQNLLVNAIKYMDKPKGQIKIDCVEENSFWKFSIADNGPGIKERYFEKIFKIFQTLAPRDEVESTGIGLSMVKKILEAYNGKIWVESEVGVGSTFFFTLPRSHNAIGNNRAILGSGGTKNQA